MVTIADDANNSDQQPTQPVKICSKCYETKPTTEFHRSAINKDGLIGYCKICHNKQVSKSKKNKSVTKIQSAFRGHRTRQQLRTQKTAKQEALDSKKIETEAERLFNNANKTNAKKALIKMVRDTDAESIEIMLYELWAELSVKKRETWLAKARKNLTKY